MMQLVTDDPSAPDARPFLSAVAPLNVQRRDDALYLLLSEYEKPLTQYDVCKTHVLADVFHLLATGRVIFGGTLYALPFGPVPDRTLDDCRRWGRRLATVAAMTGLMSLHAPLERVGAMGARDHIHLFAASSGYDRRALASWENFSDDEQANVRRAYAKVIAMPWPESQRYFHEPVSAIGYAYEMATRPFGKQFKGSTPMNWFDVLDGAERIEKVDVSYARDMLGLWT